MAQENKYLFFVRSLNRTNVETAKKYGYIPVLIRDKNYEEPNPEFSSFLDQNNVERIEIPLDYPSASDFAMKLEDISDDSIIYAGRDESLKAALRLIVLLGKKQSRITDTQTYASLIDKSEQRKLLRESFPELVPAFCLAKSKEEALEFLDNSGKPIILKPLNSTGSEYVQICSNHKDILKYWDEYRHVFSKSAGILCEEYIEGPQVSIDSYIDMDGHVYHTPACKQIIGFDKGILDFRTLCSYVDDESSGVTKMVGPKLEELIFKLGLRGWQTHIELRLDPEDNSKFKIVEINVRAGGLRKALLLRGFGISHFENFIRTISGLKPIIGDKIVEYTAAAQYWSPIIKKYDNGFESELAKKLPSYKETISHLQPSQLFGPAGKGYPRLACFLLANENKGNLFKDIESIIKMNKDGII